MKLLLDENLPKKLKQDFHNHTVFTVRDMNWQGKKNGELIQLIIENNFDALITFDKNLQYQQNFQKYSIPVILLNSSDNTYLTLKNLIGKINFVLEEKLNPGTIEITED
jgi:predicted nuclease of predicted toxin-antitoxin system